MNVRDVLKKCENSFVFFKANTEQHLIIKTSGSNTEQVMLDLLSNFHLEYRASHVFKVKLTSVFMEVLILVLLSLYI